MKSRMKILCRIGELVTDLEYTNKWIKDAQDRAQEESKRWNNTADYSEVIVASAQYKEIKAQIDILNWVLDNNTQIKTID